MIISSFNDFKVTKAWVEDGTVFREGWFSTNDLDREREITEPEAFAPVLKSYFDRCAPVTNTHDTQSFPIGHLQRGALLRDGNVFLEAEHPTDPAPFTSLPSTGSGFYARLAINDPVASHQVMKGNLGGCSYIAYASKTEPLPHGGRRYLEFSELMETTIAAFPINPKAVLRVAKAYGYNPEEKETPTMTPEEIKTAIDSAVAAALAAQKAPEQVQKAETPKPLTIEDLTVALTTHTQAIDEKITKAYSREGTGRVGNTGPTTPEDARDADPTAYIVKKASSDEELDATDKALIAELTLAALTQGMDF